MHRLRIGAAATPSRGGTVIHLATSMGQPTEPTVPDPLPSEPPLSAEPTKFPTPPDPTLVICAASHWEAAGDLDIKRILLAAARRGWASLYFARTRDTVTIDPTPSSVDDATLFGRITPTWLGTHTRSWQGIVVGTSPPDLVMNGVTRSYPGAPIAFFAQRVSRVVGISDGPGPAHQVECLRDGCIWEPGLLAQLLHASAHRDVPLPAPDGLDASGRPAVAVLEDSTPEDAAFVKALLAIRTVAWRPLGGRYASLPPAPLLLGELPTWRGVVVPPSRPLATHPWIRQWQHDLSDWRIPLIGNRDGLAPWVRSLAGSTLREVRRAVASVTLTNLRRGPLRWEEPQWVTDAWRQLAERGGEPCRKA